MKKSNKAKHGAAFSLRLRLHYKTARAGGVKHQKNLNGRFWPKAPVCMSFVWLA